MKGGLGRFLLCTLSRNALSFSALLRMYPESLLPRGSKIRALLDWFPEISRLSTHYGYSSVLVSYPCGSTQVRNACSVATDGHQDPDENYVILTKRGKIRPIFTPFRQIDHFRVKYA